MPLPKQQEAGRAEPSGDATDAQSGKAGRTEDQQADGVGRSTGSRSGGAKSGQTAAVKDLARGESPASEGGGSAVAPAPDAAADATPDATPDAASADGPSAKAGAADGLAAAQEGSRTLGAEVPEAAAAVSGTEPETAGGVSGNPPAGKTAPSAGIAQTPAGKGKASGTKASTASEPAPSGTAGAKAPAGTAKAPAADGPSPAAESKGGDAKAPAADGPSPAADGPSSGAAGTASVSGAKADGGDGKKPPAGGATSGTAGTATPTGTPGATGTVSIKPLSVGGTPERERTKQQPLPPAPGEPLKLLAELTNTPETPLRAVIRRVRIWTPLAVLLAIAFCTVQVLRPLPTPVLRLTSASSYTFSGSAPTVPWPAEGQAVLDVEGVGSFGAYGDRKPEPIASVAKIMTAYVVLHDHPITSGDGPKLTVDAQAVSDYNLGAQGESVVKVTAGEQITEYEALEDIMIASANNIARLLARWDAGSEEAFVGKMNATARQLGMSHTTYTDPSGLTATTVSTAADQVRLAEQMMTNPTFRKVVDQPFYYTASGDKYSNWNHLVGTDDVIGIKTGTSTAAGGNLVFAATKDVGGTTRLIIGAVLGQYRPSILDTVTAASRQLILTAQQELTADQVIRKGEVVGYVDDGLGGRTPVVATRDIQAVGWPGIKVPIALAPAASGVPHSAAVGTVVGTLTVGSGPGALSVPVAVGKPLSEPGFGTRLARVG